LIFITSCYNRKLSFHPILSDHINVGLHTITFEIESFKEKSSRSILVLIGFAFMTASCILFTITFAGNKDSGYLSFVFPWLLLLNYIVGISTLFLINKAWDYQQKEVKESVKMSFMTVASQDKRDISADISPFLSSKAEESPKFDALGNSKRITLDNE
jgi:hypothetical protein